METTQESFVTKNTQLNTQGIMPWVVCFTTALFFFYEFIQMNMFNAIERDLMRAFSIHAQQLGNLSAVYFYANVIFLIPAGLLLDRFSTKRIVLIAMSLCVLGTALFAGANHLSTAYACRFLTGIGSAFVFLSCMRIATRWFPAQRMALITGLIVTMAMLGGVVAQTPLTLLTEHYGWRNALYIDAGFGLLLLLLISLIVRDYPGCENTHREHRKNTREQLSLIGFWQSLISSYTKRQNWCGALYTCLMNTPLGLLGVVWGTPYLMQVHHLSATHASLVITMIFCGTIFGGPVMGMISDKIGMRRKPMLLGAVLSLATITLIISNPHLGFLSLMILFFTLGFVTSTQVLSYPTIAESNPAVLTATAVSVISLTTQGGSALLQPIFGRVLQSNWDGTFLHHIPVYSTLSYQHAIMMIPAGFIIAFIAALLIKETHCQPLSKRDS